MDVSRLEAGRLKGSFRLVNLGLVTRDLAVSRNHIFSRGSLADPTGVVPRCYRKGQS